jgi:anti-anti-sigma regulatory factor
MLTRIAAAPPGLSRLVLDLSFTMRVDVSGGDLLKRLKQELLARGITLFLADAHHPARVDLARQGLDDLLVDGTRRLTVAETLELLDQRAPVAPAC